MAILPIRQLGDPVLKEPAGQVDSFDGTLRALYGDMLETMYHAPGVGLAAPQIGISLRFFVFDAGDGQGPFAVANPVLTHIGGEQIEDEGCLSVVGLYYPTARSMNVRIEGQDLQGRPIRLEGEELRARIFQHEVDHLEGLLYLDRLSPEDRRKAMAMLRERELTGRPSPGARRGARPT